MPVESCTPDSLAIVCSFLLRRVPGVVITDKHCVDKTYPDFWLDCRRSLGLRFAPSAAAAAVAAASGATGDSKDGASADSKQTLPAALLRPSGQPDALQRFLDFGPPSERALLPRFALQESGGTLVDLRLPSVVLIGMR